MKMYHYTDSGLDNIWLVNGYYVHDTPYGKGVSIENTEAMHRVIGKWLVSLPKSINGAELRFIRLEMEMTQRDLAAVLGTSEQTLRLWEKHRRKPMPGPADRLLRALYSEFVGEDRSVRRIVQRLAELNQLERAEAHLRETRSGWSLDKQSHHC